MKIKKLISVFVCLAVLLAVIAPAAVHAEGCSCENAPIIYVKGRTAIIKDKDKKRNDKDGSNPEIPNFGEAFIQAELKRLVPIYAKGYITDNFEPFKEEFLKTCRECFKDFVLDKNGNVTNNSGLYKGSDWHNKKLRDVHKPSSDVNTTEEAGKEVYKYFYQFDCRLDPCDIADDLRDYVKAVKGITGHSKVKLMGRCLGTNIITAYLAEYGWEDIEDVLLLNPAANGTAVSDSMFCGELYFEEDAVDFFASQKISDETAPMRLLQEIITLSNKTYALDLTMDYFNMTAPKVTKYVSAEVLRECYGTTPGYWSMVSAERYEEARDYVFDGVEEEWAGLIKKIDHYHEAVRMKQDEMYEAMQKDGVNVYIVAKYGSQLLPIMKDASAQSDSIVTVAEQVPGAVAAPIGKTLSDEYINEVTEKGLGKYISPDRAIDASASVLPDRTWYIKNLSHDYFPKCIDPLLYRILRSNGEMNVFTSPEYPQYIIYEGEYNKGDFIRPMTDTDLGETLREPTFFELLQSMLQSVAEIIRDLFERLITEIQPAEPAEPAVTLGKLV